MSSLDEDLEQNKGVLVEIKAPSVIDWCDTDGEEETSIQEGGEEGGELAQINRSNREGFWKTHYQLKFEQGGLCFDRLMNKV